MMNKVIIVLIWIIIGIALIWGAGAWVVKTRSTNPVTSTADSLNEFAQCLTNEGVKMYGADWCPHCQNQKKLFGEAFKFIDYTECADPTNPRVQAKVCSNADIAGYPTWVFPSGQRIEGEASFAELSEESVCAYK